MGEVNSADREAAAAFPPQLKDYLKENAIPDEAVYNTDETALYYHLLPDRTLTTSQLPSGEEFKQSKDWVTILLTTNKTGSHNLKPLVIGIFQNPRCLHHINCQKMPVLYNHSRNAWMTSTIFHQWFQQSFVPEVRHHLWKQGLHANVVLLLDNCPAYPLQKSWPATMARSRPCCSQKTRPPRYSLRTKASYRMSRWTTARRWWRGSWNDPAPSLRS